MPVETKLDELLKCIGRNILLYQEFEDYLKKLNISKEISGFVSELEQVIQKRRESYHKKTMGQLTSELLDNEDVDFDSESDPEFSLLVEDCPPAPEIHISIEFSFGTADFWKEKKKLPQHDQ